MTQSSYISITYRVTLEGASGSRVVARRFPDLETARMWAIGKLANDQRWGSFGIEELTAQIYAGPPVHGSTTVTHSWHGDALSFGKLF
jgi:hypothetical protein